ncbi:MAG: DUF1559 domain-containing protein [Planctomycetaceae bacterium]
MAVKPDMADDSWVKYERLKCIVIRSVAVLGILAFVAAYLLIVRPTMHKAERRNVVNCVRQITLALGNYQDSFRQLPPPTFITPDGQPAVSWRGAAAIFWEAGWRHEISLSDHWKSDRNRIARIETPNVFCPSSYETRETHILAVTGEGTVFGVGSLANSDAIVLVEARNSKTHWLEPGDISVEDIPDNDTPVLHLPGIGEGEFVVGFADGAAWRLSTELPCSILKKLAIVSEAKKRNREQLLAPYRVASQGN